MMKWLKSLFSKKSFEKPKKRTYTVLTPLDVENIEQMFINKPTNSLQDIAHKFDISISTVSRIKNFTHRYSTKVIDNEIEECICEL